MTQPSPTNHQTNHRPIISFIGAGNMAQSLIHGIISGGLAVDLRVADPQQAPLDHIHKQYPSVAIMHDNQAAIEQADVVIFAVKPQIMGEVVKPLSVLLCEQKPLIISIAAGIPLKHFKHWLSDELALIRCMPNTPALVQTGATGLFANHNVTTTQHDLAEQLMQAVGLTVWLDKESDIDSVTALSGSGPAYYFFVMEAMQQAAEKLGLSPTQARLLTLQTALGAAQLAIQSQDSPAILRERVTSKGGTTEAALNTLNQGGLVTLFDDALKAAAQRAKTLAEQAPL
ncbi:MAG TPA: pyrroline-5-carboxylate reductase [Thiothrix sp.]|nr:pyrroline-5-carboxylate reductase [Thiothrix sp.]